VIFCMMANRSSFLPCFDLDAMEKEAVKEGGNAKGNENKKRSVASGLLATFAPIVLASVRENHLKYQASQLEFELRLGGEHKQHAGQFDAGLSQSTFETYKKRLLESKLIKVTKQETSVIQDTYLPETKKFKRERIRECFTATADRKLVSQTAIAKTKLLYQDYNCFPLWRYWVRASMALESVSPTLFSIPTTTTTQLKKRWTERTTLVCETPSGTVQVDFSIVKSLDAQGGASSSSSSSAKDDTMSSSSSPSSYEIEIEALSAPTTNSITTTTETEEEKRLLTWCRCAEDILSVFWPLADTTIMSKYLVVDADSLSSPLDKSKNNSGRLRSFVLVPRSIHPWINQS
jgi:hypothetical protein